MKKIMFNDQFGLTQAVLDGRKTMTRRIAHISQHGADVLTGKIPNCPQEIVSAYMLKARYKVGEVVAIAQSYETIFHAGNCPDDFFVDSSNINPKYCGAGFNNKMFSRADLLPHHIRITDIKLERLQDISDESCFREGIYASNSHEIGYGIPWVYEFAKSKMVYPTPREAFAALIDCISGKGTFNSNPYVFAYEFELVK